MDKSIIWELVFSGNCYAEKINLDKDETYTKNYEELEQKIKKLCVGMTQEETENVLWDITMLQAGIESVASEEHFKEGFKLGMLLAAQCFLD